MSFFKITIGQMIRIITIPLFLVLTSCVTSYHSAGLTGGYSEIITSTDSFLVTFKGNGFTSNEKVIQYALKRASELAIHNGYRYFVLTSSIDQTRSIGYSNTQGNISGVANGYSYSNSSNAYLKGSSSSSTYSGVIRKPGVTIGIKCFRDKPKDLDVIDALYYLEKN